jgi:hypothetical protein
LRYCAYDGSAWTVSDVIASPARSISLAFSSDSSAYPAIAYVNTDSTNVMCATRRSGSWELQPIDIAGTPGNKQGSCSLAFSPSGHPAVSYCAAQDAGYVLRYGEYTATAGWQTHTVDPGGTPPPYVGTMNFVAFAPSGLPAICYRDDGLSKLRYAECVGTVIMPGTTTTTTTTSTTTTTVAP